MKKFIFYILILVIPFVIFSQQLIMLEFEKTGFSIGLPESWDFRINDVDTLALIADSSDSQKLRLSVYSDVNVYGNDIESLYIDFSKNFFSNFSKYIIVDNIPSENRFTCYYRAENEGEYQGVFDIFIRKDRFYILSVNGYKKTYANNTALIENIRNSFSFIKISNTYINKEAGFKIDFPVGFRHTSSQNNKLYMAQGKGGENINISYSDKHSSEYGLEFYVEKYVFFLENTLHDFLFIDSREEIVDGMRAFVFKYSFVYEDEDIVQQAYLFDDGERFFSINCTASAEDFADFEKIFEECVSSFRLITKSQYKL